MQIIGFGTYDPAAHPRVSIVLDGLRARGADVVEINAPLGISTHDRVAMLHNPLRSLRLFARLLACWPRLARRGWSQRRAGPVDVVVVGYLGHFDVLLARAVFPGTTVVLDLLVLGEDTARDRRVPHGLLTRLLRVVDSVAIAASNEVIVDTAEHAATVGARARSVVVPVGAPRAWLEHPRTERTPTSGTPRLTVVFFGLFTPLQGVDVLGRAIAELADDDIDFTVVGDGQDRAHCQALASGNDRVEWIDWLSPDDLVETVARHDVCLGIFGTTPKGLRVVPNKVYQGAAAGCAIVTSDTAPQRRTLGDAAVFVPPGDHVALVGALRDLAADTARTRRLGAAARDLASTAFTPTAVVEELCATIGLDDRGRPAEEMP